MEEKKEIDQEKASNSVVLERIVSECFCATCDDFAECSGGCDWIPSLVDECKKCHRGEVCDVVKNPDLYT